MPTLSSRRLRALAVIAAGSLVGLSATTAVAATRAPIRSGVGASPTEYAIGVPACAPPAPGNAQCFAVRRVVVAKGTLGARAFHPLAATTATATPDAVTAGPGGGYTPADLASAYGVNPAVGGTGQTVALVDAFNDPDITSNLDTFDSHYHLPAETASSFKVVGQTGSTSVLPANDTTGWSEEETLDVDTVRGLCNHCKIVLVEANSQSQTDLGLSVDEAVKLGATEVSNSYGYPEQNDASQPTDPNELTDYNHPGVVLTVSTGDDGWYDFDFMDGINSPNQPSTLPGVVGVGGTTLNLTPSGKRASETVWNDNGPADEYQQELEESLGATGGGCSTIYTAPAWQQHVAGHAALGCGTKRSPADISADADYLTGYDTYDTYVDEPGDGKGWETFGGTSLAAPMIAAMWALAGGSHGMAYPAASLYGHSGAHSPFYDVTVGGNSYCDAQAVCQLGGTTLNSDGLLDCATNAAGTLLSDTAQCDAEPGFDGPSGLGAPNGLSEFRPATPTARITASAHAVKHKAVKFSATKSTDPYPGGRITKYVWSWGDGSKSSSAAKASHRFTKAGKHTVRLTVTDSYGQTGTTSLKVRVKK